MQIANRWLSVACLLLANLLCLTGCGGGTADEGYSSSSHVTLDANLDSRTVPVQVAFDPSNEQSYNFAASFVIQSPKVQKLTFYFRKLGLDTPVTWSVHVAVDNTLVSRNFVLHFNPDGSPDRGAPRFFRVYESDDDYPLVIDFGEVVQYGAPTQFFDLI